MPTPYHRPPRESPRRGVSGSHVRLGRLFVSPPLRLAERDREPRMATVVPAARFKRMRESGLIVVEPPDEVPRKPEPDAGLAKGPREPVVRAPVGVADREVCRVRVGVRERSSIDRGLG